MYHDFVNPYNFIPLGKKRADALQEDRTLTGVITYSFKTETPLVIPNTANSDIFPKQKQEFLRKKKETVTEKEYDKIAQEISEHKMYDFFTYTDVSDTTKDYTIPYAMPVISGSEIRGMLRSNFEILTNSCMSVLNDDVILSKRTNEVFVAGLLRKDGENKFSLCKANDYLFRTKGENCLIDELEWKEEYYTRKCYIQEDLLEGTMVSFEAERRERGKPLAKRVKKIEGKTQGNIGYVMKGLKGPEMNSKNQKHCCHIFQARKQKRGNQWIDEIVAESVSLQILDIVLQAYESNADNIYQEYQTQLTKFREFAVNGSYFPVYYSQIGDFVMLSPASITREVYRNTLKEIVGNYIPCDGTKTFCPTCSLFGMVHSNGTSRASRLRFSDMVCVNKETPIECYEKIVTLPPLSSPKRSNMEFYLQRPKGAWFWTYDYYVQGGTGTVVPTRATINGRKFYWHNRNMKLPENVDMTKLNVTVRPVKKDVIFTGKVYFEKISETELKQLVWLLNNGENVTTWEEKNYGYKLGMAKPLGFGSVSLRVEEVKVRTLKKDAEERRISFVEEPRGKEAIVGCFDTIDFKVEENFHKMTSFAMVSEEKIHYPMTKPNEVEEEHGFEWFAENHKGYNYKKGEMKNMPNARKEMIFRMHMIAMQPQLQWTDKKLEQEKKESTRTAFSQNQRRFQNTRKGNQK